jgi:hypothetical protein
VLLINSAVLLELSTLIPSGFILFDTFQLLATPGQLMIGVKCNVDIYLCKLTSFRHRALVANLVGGQFWLFQQFSFLFYILIIIMIV